LAVRTREQSGWRGGWTAIDPPEIGFAWAPNIGGGEVERDGLLWRELGLEETSGGALGVRRFKVGEPEAAARWRSLDVDFDFLYVLRGAVTVANELGEEVRFTTGSSALHPGGLSYRLADFSEDFEAVQVTSPARYEVVVGSPPSPSGEGTAWAGAAPVYTHDGEEQYAAGGGPREFFVYRDLRTREPTDGRVHFHVIRATEPGRGTGWHFHTMAQWFMVVGGSAVISVEDRPRQPLAPGDSMCVGRGPRMRHNVSDFSADYRVLEMCIPAEYDTVTVSEPEGADAP
jgi:quercetin dioxygenase-like cupin family protein